MEEVEAVQEEADGTPVMSVENCSNTQAVFSTTGTSTEAHINVHPVAR